MTATIRRTIRHQVSAVSVWRRAAINPQGEIEVVTGAEGAQDLAEGATNEVESWFRKQQAQHANHR